MFFHGGLSGYVAVLAFGIFVWNHHLVQSLNVEPVLPTINTTLNATVELQWQVTLEPTEKIISVIVQELPRLISILTGNTDGFNVDQEGRELFGDRVSGIYNKSNNIVTLTLQNILHNETLKFQLVVVLSTFVTKAANISIVEISGSPSLCGRNLESIYTVNEDGILNVVQFICGYPNPEVKWKVGDDNFSKSYNLSEINTAIRQYKYIFITRPITRNECGRTLIFVANNTVGRIKRNAELDVKFVPSLVSMVSLYRHNASCVRVTWDAEDTGKCNVSYHLQFTGRETIYNSSNRYFTLCNSSDVDTVIIWASYKGNNGWKLASRISTTTSSPYFTSTTNIATTNAGKSVPRTCDCQSTINVIIAIVVTLAITLILITIIFIISKHKGYITVNIHRKRPPQSYENRSTDDYEEAGATVSHYADIDTKAVKPSIYADLTTTTDNSKQYAEIELHKRNTYANIKD